VPAYEKWGLASIALTVKALVHYSLPSIQACHDAPIGPSGVYRGPKLCARREAKEREIATLRRRPWRDGHIKEKQCRTDLTQSFWGQGTQKAKLRPKLALELRPLLKLICRYVVPQPDAKSGEKATSPTQPVRKLWFV
jgi:hypothetical protein